MKKTLFIYFTLVMYCKSVDATEIRRFVAEPYHAQVYYDTFVTPDVLYITPYYCGSICFKFYDTLLGYTNCPCAPDDTATDVHWFATGGGVGENLDTVVRKGTVFYKCWDNGNIQFQPGVYNGIAYGFIEPIFWIFDCKVNAKFALKELESSCNYKKLQILDSSEHIWSIDSLSKWYLTVRDSLNNIVHSDSGFEVSPYRDSAFTIIERQRPSPIVELHNSGVYSITLIIEKNSGLGSYLNDTSTIYNIRVQDCATGIRNNSITNNDIHLQLLDNNQLQINSKVDKELELDIYSLDGKKVFANKLKSNNNIYDLSKFIKGLYIVIITDESSVLVFSNKIVLKR